MDVFACSSLFKVNRMPNFNSEGHSQDRQRHPDSGNENLSHDEDMIIEQILDNINTTPIGQVLKKIASLPEVRREKVLDVRRQLTQGEYDLNKRLDVALDKVLEDLTT